MSSGEDEIRQTLMRADEVYVYKIPPLKSSGGHRAEDWNLSTPLQTCNLRVEQVGHTGHKLCLSFYTQGNEPTLFAESTVDASNGSGGKDASTVLEHWLEQVVDSSRYFAVKIQGAGNREATIGFGFRDREQATDLRESLQYYLKSLQREQTAASLSGSYSLPKLAEGEKIHVDRKSGKSSKVKSKSLEKKKGSGVPLLKKPPPSPPEETKPKVAPPAEKKKAQKMTIDMDNLNLNDDDDGGGDDGSSSGGAVYEGDETQWATEFDMK